jgi:hypothetical protein
VAISKKYSRRIVVDGVAYRWKIDPEPDYDQWHLGELVVRVWRDDTPNCVLHLLGGRRPEMVPHGQADTITPRRVAAGVRTALARGWNPAGAGGFHLALSAVTEE